MKRKLFHFRAHSVLGALRPEGGMTLALHYDEESKRLSYGVSIAVPQDMFNRRRGRQIANGRLDKGMEVGPGFCRGTVNGVFFTDIKKTLVDILRTCITQLDLRLKDNCANRLKIVFLYQCVLDYHRYHGILVEKKEEMKEE